MIRRRNFARTLAAAFLLAAVAALLLLPSTPGHAQSADTTLVSNTAQTPRLCGDDASSYSASAQEFTTGSHSSGYDLTSVSLYGGAALSSVPLIVTLRAESSGEPSSTSLATFTKPSSWVVGDNEFPAPSGTHLTADTTYFIHAAATASIQWCNVSTLSTSAASSGWSLGRLQDDDSGWTDYSSDYAYIIAIKGTAAAATNSAATGAPTITGTALVGDPMRAVTSGIMDADGLTSPTFTYQWIRVDGATESDISGATSSTYTPVAADLGKTIKVKVSFTDDGSNAETLTSAATAAVGGGGRER